MSYFSYFHSIMSYGIIFRGNSSQNNSIVKNQKRTIGVSWLHRASNNVENFFTTN